MRKRILFISPNQFGYLTDYYYFCKYLRNDFDIHFLCFDRGLKKRSLDTVKVHYVSFSGNLVARLYRWLIIIKQMVKKTNFDVIFLENHKLVMFIKLILRKQNITLDIRTGGVAQNEWANYIDNSRIRMESAFFEHVTILSKALIHHLKLKPSKCHYLPLGAEIINGVEKSFESIKLLYVGSLSQRNIHETIIAFGRLYMEKRDEINCSYDIFGFGNVEEEKVIVEHIERLNLTGIVRFHGRKNHDEIRPYFEQCNVGVSYIPMTKFYDFQPPTKTFEYILAGMICLATSTFENRKIVNNENGILCQDNVDSFYDALANIYQNRKEFNQKEITNSLSNYSWFNIVNQNLKPYLNSLMR